MLMRLLFVCTGNTCRSSMAEAIAKKKINENEKYKDIIVESAGVFAFNGSSASNEAIYVMQNRGIDLKYHKARSITPDIIKNADLILTMTENHKRAVSDISKSANMKTFTLKEYASGEKGDILDPFGHNIKVYESCADELEMYIEKVLEKIA